MGFSFGIQLAPFPKHCCQRFGAERKIKSTEFSAASLNCIRLHRDS